MKWRMSISAKLSILITVLVCSVAATFNLIYSSESKRILTEKAVSDLTQEANFFEFPLLGQINQLRDDVRFLRAVPPTDGLIRTRFNRGMDPLDGSTEKQWLYRLSTIFREMLRTREHYLQIRYIGVTDGGKEILRVDRFGQEIVTIPKEKLQRKGERSYFRETIELKEGEIYLSEIELNREHGKIKKPYQLTLRAAVPVYDQEARIFGIVIVNVNFSEMLISIKNHIVKDRLLYIANSRGSYIYHPDSSKLYADDLKTKYRIQEDYPRLLEVISKRQKNMTLLPERESGQIVSLSQFYYDERNKNRYLSMVTLAPYSEVVNKIREAESQGVSFIFLVAFLSVVVAIFSVKKILLPLGQVTNAVVQYRQGKRSIVLPIDSRDEIGILAKEFSKMARQKGNEDWVKENILATSKNLLGLSSFEELSKTLIEALTPLVNGNVGALYLDFKFPPKSQSIERGHLWLAGSYGYERQEEKLKTIRLKEGLVGQCASDKQIKEVSSIEESQLNIDLGLMKIRAGHCIIFPIMYEEDVLGVLEIGSTEVIDEKYRSFLSQICFNIGVIIHSLAANVQTQILLEKSQKTTKELRRSNQELDDFAYIASHDLKEPLRGLFNNSRFLLEDYQDKLDEEGVGMLKRLTYLSQRMEMLVNDLLYFSRLGRQELAIQKTDFNSIIGEIESLMETTIEEENVRIVIPHPLPEIVCDRIRMTEVFRNLITNAVKYSDKDEKQVEVGFISNFKKEDGEELSNVFYVKDNGIGIASEFHDEVFRIFKRLNEEDDAKKGTGVGLTFVKKIIERHNGRIWLTSTLGEGTTFYFKIEGEVYESSRGSEDASYDIAS